MSQYITELAVSLNEAEESQCRAQGFSKINVDLNKGAGGNNIYLWYKRGRCSPITGIQFSFTDGMTKGLIQTGFHKIDKDLNAGAWGKNLFLWYRKGLSEYDVPIVDLHVSTDTLDEAQKFKYGWERLACDLNRNAGGNFIYLWVKREKQTYICHVTATATFDEDADLFQKGFIRVDEDTNRDAGGAWVYIWYRQTTDINRALTSLQISTNDDEYQSCQQQNYQIVNVDLNQETRGNQVFLWYKKDEGSRCTTIRVVTVMLNPSAVEPFERVGVQVIKRNLNAGNDGYKEFLCYACE